MQRVEARRLQLAPSHLEVLKGLLEQHVPHAEVWAYGSRVKGGSHEGSDLDLVLRNPRDPTQNVAGYATLKDALQVSSLPMLVEVHQWAQLPESFRPGIEAAHVVVQIADV